MDHEDVKFCHASVPAATTTVVSAVTGTRRVVAYRNERRSFRVCPSCKLVSDGSRYALSVPRDSVSDTSSPTLSSCDHQETGVYVNSTPMVWPSSTDVVF